MQILEESSKKNSLPLIKREALKLILQQKNFGDITEELETGLFYYMRDLIVKLRKIS